MLKTIVLVSKIPIARSEFAQFLQQVGAEKNGYDEVYDAQLYDRSGGYLWIMYEPEEELFGDELASRIETITQKLGSPPATQVQVEIGKNGSSKMLAAEFVSKFYHNWPCIIDDDTFMLYSVPDFIELCRQGKNF